MGRIPWEQIDDTIIDLRDRKVPWDSIKKRIKTVTGYDVGISTLQKRLHDIEAGIIDPATKVTGTRVVHEGIAGAKGGLPDAIKLPDPRTKYSVTIPVDWKHQIVEFRNLMGWSKLQLSLRMECSDETIRRWELGDAVISEAKWNSFKAVRAKHARKAEKVERAKDLDLSFNFNIGGKEVNCPHNLDSSTVQFMIDLVESISPNTKSELEELLKRLSLERVLV